MYEVILKRFDKPDAVRNFEKGRFELVKVGKMTIGRATYDPGWKWSEHVGKFAGEKSCMVEHVGLVVAGRAVAAMDDGRVIDLKPGDLFYIAPGHDSWVVGNDHSLRRESNSKASLVHRYTAAWTPTTRIRWRDPRLLI